MTRWAGVALALALLWLGGWWLTTPDAVATGGGHAASPAPTAGRPIHVGLPGTVRADLTVRWARPVLVGDAEAVVRLCRARPGGHTVGVQEEGLEKLCTRLDPVGPGTRLEAERPSGDSADYLVVTITPRTDGPLALCGLDLGYRTGLRLGRHPRAGTMTVTWGAEKAELPARPHDESSYDEEWYPCQA